jgi:hypothetical protein
MELRILRGNAYMEGVLKIVDVAWDAIKGGTTTTTTTTGATTTATVAIAASPAGQGMLAAEVGWKTV